MLFLLLCSKRSPVSECADVLPQCRKRTYGGYDCRSNHVSVRPYPVQHTATTPAARKPLQATAREYPLSEAGSFTSHSAFARCFVTPQCYRSGSPSYWRSLSLQKVDVATIKMNRQLIARAADLTLRTARASSGDSALLQLLAYRSLRHFCAYCTTPSVSGGYADCAYNVCYRQLC